MGGRNLGGAAGHIKAITLLPFPHQRKVYTEAVLDLMYAVENTACIPLTVVTHTYTPFPPSPHTPTGSSLCAQYYLCWWDRLHWQQEGQWQWTRGQQEGQVGTPRANGWWATPYDNKPWNIPLYTHAHSLKCNHYGNEDQDHNLKIMPLDFMSNLPLPVE